MNVDATPTTSPRSARRSRRCPGRRRSTLVTREEALARFQQSMKEQGREDLSKYLDTNPFPPSYEIKLTDPSFAERRRGRPPAEPNPAVRNVLDTKETAENVKTVTDIMRTGRDA